MKQILLAALAYLAVTLALGLALAPDRLGALFTAGADSAAVVTDIATAADPVARCRAWIAATREMAR